MKRIFALIAVAGIAAAAQAQTGRLFVGEYGYDAANLPTCFETDLSPGFPGNVSWSATFPFAVQGAACTPGNVIYLSTGTFTTDLYTTFPGRTPTRVAQTSETIFDMGYVGGKLYGWAAYASPSGIYEINTTTGQCTLAVASTSELFFALDGNPADGLLYGYSEYGNSGLYSINPITGAKHKIANGPYGQFPNAYGMYRGLAVGNNTVYLTNVWNGRALDDPDHIPSDSFYAYNLGQGDNGTYVQFANPYANSTPAGGGSFWYDPSVIPVPPTPANELCANATPIGEGTFAFDTTWANTEGSASCGAGGVGDVWFRYTPTFTHYALFSTGAAGSLDTVLTLYTGCDGTEIDCNDDGATNAPLSQIGYTVTAGVPIIIRIAGYDEAARGPGTLNIGLCPPATISRQPDNATINSCTATLPSDFSQGPFFVRFFADLSGGDTVNYQWEKNGVPMSDNNDGNIENYGIYNTRGWALLIVRPTAADAGTYRCVMSTTACNEQYNFTSNNATLTFVPKCSIADVAPVANCGDGIVDGSDFIAFINSFGVGDVAIDRLADIAGGGVDGLSPDGIIDGNDFIAFINAFSAGC